jgi:acyl-CoA dehydrogenase
VYVCEHQKKTQTMHTIFTTDRVRSLLPSIRELLHAHLFPLEAEGYMSVPFSEVEPHLLRIRTWAKERGLWGLHLPHSEGGLGLTLCEFGQLSEALAQSPFGHYVLNCQAPDIGNMELMASHASPELRARWLQPLLHGEVRSCFAMTEPQFAGSNPVRLGCTAVSDGNDYIINGHKWFTTGADGAAFCIVMAVTQPDAPPHLRASQILVPCDTPGFRIVRNIPVMGHAGDGWMSHSEVMLEGVRVPKTNRIGADGDGFRLAQERLGPGRIHHCMRFVGIAERSIALMIERARQRSLTESSVLADQQIIQTWLAESRADTDAARLLVLQTAHLIDQQGAAAARADISKIKFFAANAMLRVVDRAVQVHGALGLTSDTVLSFWYAHERAARIYDGADEVHKLSLAKAMLKSNVIM